MDPIEANLITEHKVASQHYRWAVEELIRQRANVDREDLQKFLAAVVTPARRQLYELFCLWLRSYRTAR